VLLAGTAETGASAQVARCHNQAAGWLQSGGACVGSRTQTSRGWQGLFLGTGSATRGPRACGKYGVGAYGWGAYAGRAPGRCACCCAADRSEGPGADAALPMTRTRLRTVRLAARLLECPARGSCREVCGEGAGDETRVSTVAQTLTSAQPLLRRLCALPALQKWCFSPRPAAAARESPYTWGTQTCTCMTDRGRSRAEADLRLFVGTFNLGNSPVRVRA
jgi:hypothetical protein